MTKKNVESAGVEESLARRQKIESSIQGLISQLGHLANVQQLGIDCGEARTRAESFLRGRGNGNEANIPAAWQGEYSKLKEDAEKKRQAYATAKQKDEALRKELADLKAELEMIGRQAAAADVKKYQDEAADIESRIEELKQAVMRENDKIALCNTGSRALADLHREREDLMADIAIGATGNKPRLAEIEAQISKEETRISETKKVKTSAEIVINGLQRKVAEAEKALANVKETLQTVYCDFLISEAEKEGAKFVEMSGKLWEQFSRIIALGTMIENHPEAQGVSIISGECRGFKIPSFILKSCPSDSPVNGFLHKFNQLDISEATGSVKRDIAALGIK